ncbi:class I SAM-dependent methyltransferase [Candidatus Saccharibacteria bacterium]|nr:class I SAM-dependent methyltransferase [Candidatus Saccharibacteria bacterium]
MYTNCMENQNKLPGNYWDSSIESERVKPAHYTLEDACKEYAHSNVLILGDASKVNAAWLINEAGTNHVTVVDSSHMLLDENVLSPDNPKLTCIKSDFTEYKPTTNDSFDMVYGKSITFCPKSYIRSLLELIHECLELNGIFIATFGGKEDSFRHENYTRVELIELLEGAGFELINIEEVGPEQSAGLVVPGTQHYFRVTSQRRN